MDAETWAMSMGRCGKPQEIAGPSAIGSERRSTSLSFSVLSICPVPGRWWSASTPSWISLVMHHSNDLLLFMLTHERWEFVYQPTYAAYLNLIEPWWKVLRSLALKGRRFQTWKEIEDAVEDATAYWNAHKHPFVWGRRRRHQPPRRSGIAVLPKVA